MGLDPVTMLVVAGVASGVTGAVSGFGAAKDAEKVGRVDAALARKNAAVTARRLRLEGERGASTAIARFGASGVTLVGSPILVATEILSEKLLEADLALEAGEFAAFSTEAKAAEKARRSRLRGVKSLISGGTSIIGGLGKKGNGKKKSLGFEIDELE